MSARHDYPITGSAGGGYVWMSARLYVDACDELDRLRALAREAWEWDDGDRLPGRIPELLDALGWDK